MAGATANAGPSVRRKLALVIGVGAYENVSKLKNPQNDAKALSSLLRRIGFITGEPQLDKTCVEIKHSLVSFEHSIQCNDIVLFYFAGHGVQWEDQNYLMPKDCPEFNAARSNEEKATMLQINAINAQDVLDQLSKRQPYVTVFLLDCCRGYVLRNPDLDKRALNTSNSGSIGLREMHKAGSLIVFACAPGTFADDRPREQNSLFMKHLLRHIATPNEDIVNILRDVTDGVMGDSKSKQIPFMSVQLRHRNIYVYEQGEGKQIGFE